MPKAAAPRATESLPNPFVVSRAGPAGRPRPTPVRPVLQGTETGANPLAPAELDPAANLQYLSNRSPSPSPWARWADAAALDPQLAAHCPPGTTPEEITAQLAGATACPPAPRLTWPRCTRRIGNPRARTMASSQAAYIGAWLRPKETPARKPRYARMIRDALPQGRRGLSDPFEWSGIGHFACRRPGPDSGRKQAS